MIYDVVAAYPDMIGGACIDEYTAIYEAFKKDLKRKMNKNKSTGIGKLKNKIQALVKRRTAV